jgi:hypothetical protein
MYIISLDQDVLHWAIAAADESIARWGNAPGHYRNQWTSHLVGRLGEAAAEQFLRQRGLPVQSHFRFPEREAMCDIEIASVRLDVKTWSATFWPDLGRCVAVNQLPVLERKADAVLWCVLHEKAALPKDEWLDKPSVRVALWGYSTLADIRQSPISLTGRPGMPQVRNHQVAEKNIRPFDELMSLLVRRV